jgi:hypothetical protein
MAVTLAGLGSFNVGKDCRLTLIGPYGKVTLDNVTGFTSAQRTQDVRVKRLDGVNLEAMIPDGWTFSFDLERGSSTVDDLFSEIEADWITNGNLPVSQMYQYITEASGSISTYEYLNAPLKLSSAGDWKGDTSTKQRIEGTATQRRKVS